MPCAYPVNSTSKSRTWRRRMTLRKWTTISNSIRRLRKIRTLVVKLKHSLLLVTLLSAVTPSCLAWPFPASTRTRSGERSWLSRRSILACLALTCRTMAQASHQSRGRMKSLARKTMKKRRRSQNPTCLSPPLPHVPYRKLPAASVRPLVTLLRKRSEVTR